MAEAGRAAETNATRTGLSPAMATAWLGLLLILLGLLYSETTRRMVMQWWNEEDYNHGFVVPLFSAWLVWENRKRLKGLPVLAAPATN